MSKVSTYKNKHFFFRTDTNKIKKIHYAIHQEISLSALDSILILLHRVHQNICTLIPKQDRRHKHVKHNRKEFTFQHYNCVCNLTMFGLFVLNSTPIFSTLKTTNHTHPHTQRKVCADSNASTARPEQYFAESPPDHRSQPGGRDSGGNSCFE